MDRLNSVELVFRTDPGRLSKVINICDTVQDAWNEKDLPAMLRHQLSAPLKFDLSSKKGKGAALKTCADILDEADSLAIITLLDLFQHPSTPLALVKLTKDFFKIRAGRADNRRPDQRVAYLIYLLLILHARIRLGSFITKLTDAQLLHGVEWASSQTWLDQTSKALLLDARKKLQENKRSPLSPGP